MLSETDLSEAVSSGAFAVDAAISGETGKMIAFSRVSDSPYELRFTTEDVNHICNQEKTVPAEWIIRDGSDLSDDFITYARPLIEGEVNIPKENGLPKFAYRKH